MSYEPILIISYVGMIRNIGKICDDGLWSQKEVKEGVMPYLKEVYTTLPRGPICGVDVIICHPEPSSFNAAVRQKLTDLKIDFSVISNGFT